MASAASQRGAFIKAPASPVISNDLLSKFRLSRIDDLDILESGAYWPQLQPYFIKPYFRRLTYQLTARSAALPGRKTTLSVRGAGGLGPLDIAYITDCHAATMFVGDGGLPDYCLTAVNRGSLDYASPTRAETAVVSPTVGVIYRGLPGTQLRAAENHERLAIWIPAGNLEQGLTALLGDPGHEALDFDPIINWSTGGGPRVRRLIGLLMEELTSPHSLFPNDLATRSLTDLLVYTLLQSLPHNYTARLARAAASPVPRSIHRAEEFIRANAEQPLSLHEIADVAGCSVRSLQLGFKHFRVTTPGAVILQARLAAVRQALAGGEAAGTVIEVAYRYGFTNPGRFTRQYRAAFGESPADALRRNSVRRTRR
ncbi:AraC-binding-like domain-containing protein [Rhizobiales bacterium GAS188]|nr:AraC-binding-like domain-containing protein [Rhizobiales bacterium GAS188]